MVFQDVMFQLLLVDSAVTRLILYGTGYHLLEYSSLNYSDPIVVYFR